ncbi:MAG: vWA domain-containing protein [Solirubrobacterales bacterium]
MAASPARYRLALAFLALALLVVALALPRPAGAAATASAGCTKATNIEAIVDDSGSMAITDPDKLRVQAMDLLIDSLGPSTTLGAVEFGSGLEAIPGVYEGTPPAETLFPPEAVGPSATAMQAALKAHVNADNGATDYNGAFAKADADNPTAQARIFLTDGGHDEGEYKEAHLAHNVPTYVIGFGSGLGSAKDKARLKKIAADTGGQVYELDDASELQAVANAVASALTCQTPPQSFHDDLSKGDSAAHAVTIGAATKAVRVVLSWASPQSRFALKGLTLVRGKQVLAAARPHRPRKLKVTTKATSKTFAIYEVHGLSRGKLRFQVRAAKVAGGSARVITQVSQRAHR